MKPMEYQNRHISREQLLSNTLHHFATITKHKALVFELCTKAGLPWQGLTHDLSKYSPTEFSVGAHYFQGNRSPNAAERHDKGFSEGWMHHKGRNPHHYEYWTDMREGGDGTLYGVPIPTRYMVEMMCDRIAASKVYKGKDYNDSCPLEYFELELSFGNLPMNPESAAFLYALLSLLAEKGEDETMRFVRKHIVEPRFIYTPGGAF